MGILNMRKIPATASQTIITPVQTKRDWRVFINLPWLLYKNDPHWVPPLKSEMWDTVNPKKNALMKLGPYQYFLAWRNGQPVGRIGTGIDEKLNREKNRKEGYITLFESINDYDVAKELFDAALGWLKERGMTAVTGPQSPTNGDDYRGLLVKGFDSEPVLLNSYNPPYYVEFFDRYGFTKFFDRYAFYYDLSKPLTKRFEESVDLLKKRYNFTTRKLNLKKLDQELVGIQKLLVRAWPENWPDMVPPSLAEIQDEVNQLLPVADQDLLVVAEDAQGKIVGLAIALPDYNQVFKRMNGRLFPIGFLKFLWYKKKINGGRSLILMVDPDYHKKGVSAAMYLQMFQNAIRKGYKYGEGSTIHEFNTKMVNDAIRAGGELYKIYRIYRKDL
ncbi:MAG TPA: N-acetyltransferase [Capillibacterium sp.]